MKSTSVRASCLRCFASVFVTALLLALAGCGSGSTSQNQNPQPNTTALQVNFGDGPSDRLVAASMTFSSMTLNKASGGTVSVMPTSTPVEMMHLMGTVQPMTLTSVPQGSYSGMTVNVSSAIVMYMDPTTHQLIQKSVPGPMSANVNFSLALTVGTSPRS